MDQICEFTQSAERAKRDSDAIFLGKVVDEQVTPVVTKFHGTSENWRVLFLVDRSWRLVDKEYVWVETSGKFLQCEQLEVGKSYIVFANTAAGGLHIHPASRSRSVGNDLSEITEDQLGQETLRLAPGEFQISSANEVIYTLAGYAGAVLVLLLAIQLFLKRAK